MRWALALLAALPAVTSAEARVVSTAANGFEVAETIVIAASPDTVYAQLIRPGRWWSSDHTYSGDAANMRLDAKAGGCFCERIPKGGGSIEHGRIVYAQPGQALRLRGGLGPLQGEGADGALTWTLRSVGGATELSQSYVVGGYIRGGAEAMAPLVDTVLSEQLRRLKAHIEKPR